MQIRQLYYHDCLSSIIYVYICNTKHYVKRWKGVESIQESKRPLSRIHPASNNILSQRQATCKKVHYLFSKNECIILGAALWWSAAPSDPRTAIEDRQSSDRILIAWFRGSAGVSHFTGMGRLKSGTDRLTLFVTIVLYRSAGSSFFSSSEMHRRNRKYYSVCARDNMTRGRTFILREGGCRRRVMK